MAKTISNNIIEEETTEEVIEKKQKATTVKSEDNTQEIWKRLEELEKNFKSQIAEKDKVIEKQNKIIEELGTKGSETQDTATVLAELIKSLKGEDKPSDKVKVIHLDDVKQAHYKLQNGMEIKFHRYGEVMTVSEDVAEMLLNKYRKTFERGALNFDSEHQYMLANVGIDTSKINYKFAETVKDFDKMSKEQAKQFFDTLAPFQVEALKLHIINKIREADKAYRTTEVIENIRYLNKLSKEKAQSKRGAFDYIIEKLNEAKID